MDTGFDEFKSWLSTKLVSLSSDIDLEVYVAYIVGILENEASNDSRESLLGILSGITDGMFLEDYVTHIISKWAEVNKGIHSKFDQTDGDGCVNLDLKMHDIINKQTLGASLSNFQKTMDGHEKAQILANYSQISDDGEESDNEHMEPGLSRGYSKSAIVKNMNALIVKERESESRNKAKLEVIAKKQKDKEDKERQRQKIVDRKEHEKKRTQKGERRQ